jgi:hypothetical protein
MGVKKKYLVSYQEKKTGIFGVFRPSLKIKILFFCDFQGRIEESEKIPKVSYIILSYLILSYLILSYLILSYLIFPER